MANTKGTHQAGRPTKRTPDVEGKLEMAFRNKFTVAEACDEADIDTTTYHDWCKKDASFSHRMAQAKTFPYRLAKNKLLVGMQKGGFKEALEFLRNTKSDEFSTAQKVEHSGEVKVGSLKEVPTAELERLAYGTDEVKK